MKIVLVAAGSAVGILALALAAIAVLSAIGSARMRGLYAVEKAALKIQARPAFEIPAGPSAPRALPDPVRKSLERQARPGPAGIKLAVLRQRGTFRTSPTQSWMPFEAEEAYSFDPPGFLWLARLRAAPGVSIWVRDKYADGAGNMLVRPLGFFTLADARGAELDQGAALRLLSEILVFPGAALSPHISWSGMDGRKARATFEDAGHTVQGVVEFDANGDMTAFYADRYQARGGRFVQVPWLGLIRDWKAVDGVRIPTHWEAVWREPEGDFTYFRADILSVETE